MRNSVGVNSAQSFSDGELTVLHLMSTLLITHEVAFPDEQSPV